MAGENEEYTIDDVADEVATKMENDPRFAEAVVKGISENDDLSEKMLDDTPLAAKLTKHLLTGDANLVDKVRGELEAEGMRIETDDHAAEYDAEQAKKDLMIAGRAAMKATDPADEAKSAGEEGSAFVQKATEETDFTSAGLTIPTPTADKVIPILDSEPAFLAAGAMVMGVPNGKLDITRKNADPTANWQGEGDTVTVSDAGFDLLQLTAHKLTVGHEFSNDFLRRDGALIGQSFMFSRMMRAARNELDSTILEGGGGSNQPEGLITQVDSSHVNSSNGSTITNITNDAKQAHRLLAGADVPEENRRWFMRPEVEIDMAFDINANEDTFPLREEVAERGTLFGAEIETTTNINLDGSDNSNIYFVEMSEMLVGRGTNFEMATSPHEKFTQDLTILRLVSHWDFQMAHTAAASVITDYTLQ